MLLKSVFPTDVAPFICMPDYYILKEEVAGKDSNSASKLRSSRVKGVCLQLHFLGSQVVSFWTQTLK